MQHMMEEIETIREASGDKVVRFKAAVDSLNERWDKLQICLLEASVFDSTVHEAEGDSSSRCIADSSSQHSNTLKTASHDAPVEESEERLDDIPSLAAARLYASLINESDCQAASARRHQPTSGQTEDVIHATVVNQTMAGIDFGTLEAYPKPAASNSNVAKPKQDGERELDMAPSGGLPEQDSELCEATTLDDQVYVDEFANRIQELDRPPPASDPSECNTSTLRKPKLHVLTSTPKSEADRRGKARVEEPDDIWSSSIGSIVSDSSGIFSTDHEEHSPAIMDLILGSLSNRLMMNRACVNQQEAFAVYEANDLSETPYQEPRGLVQRTGKPVMEISDGNPTQDAQQKTPCDIRESDGESAQGAQQTTTDNKWETAEPACDDKLEWMNVSFEDHDQELHYNKINNNIENASYKPRARNTAISLTSDGSTLVEKEDYEHEEPDVVEIKLQPMFLPPVNMEVCAIDDSHPLVPTYPLVDSQNEFVGNVLYDKIAESQEEIKERSEAERQSGDENIGKADSLVDLMSLKSDEVDFIELCSRLEASMAKNRERFSSITSKEDLQSGENLEAGSSLGFIKLGDMPSIDVTPPTPRRNSLSNANGVCLPQQYDHGSVAMINADTAEMPVSSPLASVGQELTTARGYPLARAMSVPAPDINVIPPTPRRQSLDLAPPYINVIPPTPRRMSLSSVHDNAMPATAAEQNQTATPDVFSSEPASVMPRVWNWIESSQFDSSHQDDAVDGPSQHEADATNATEQRADSRGKETCSGTNSAKDEMQVSEDSDKIEAQHKGKQFNDPFDFPSFFDEQNAVLSSDHAYQIDVPCSTKPVSVKEEMLRSLDANELELAADRESKLPFAAKEGDNGDEADYMKEGSFSGAGTSKRNTGDIDNQIHSQIQDISAQQLALKQRRDSGTLEEFGAASLEDLIDAETHEAVAAGMDEFYTRIQNCLESMKNINQLSDGDGEQASGGQQELANQMRVCI